MNLFLRNKRQFCITHRYSYVKDYVYIANFGNIDVVRASVYCQFMYETHIDESGILSNVEIAALLCMFYGFYQCGHSKNCTIVDIYIEREQLVGSYFELINDTFLYREELLMVLKQIHRGQCLCYEHYKQEEARLMGAMQPLAATT